MTTPLRTASSPRHARLAWPCALALLMTAWSGAACLELEGLDPDKPLPAAVSEASAPAPRCSIEGLAPQPLDLKFYAIDVAQGDALLIQTPDDGVPGNGVAEGLNILIDAGNDGTLGSTNGADYVVDWLDQLGVERIDYAIVSHAHADHYGGMREVFAAKDIINIIDPGYDPATTTYRTYLAAAEAEVAANGGTLYRPAFSALVSDGGFTLDWGSELGIELIYASASAELGERDNTRVNNTSIVLKLDYQGRRILFMGDAEEEVEELLLSQGADLTAEVLKVGHHGSSSSSSRPFLDAVFSAVPEEERYAVISSGRKSFSGTTLPTISTLANLRSQVSNSKIFSTEANDDDKPEEDAAGDDNVLIILREDATLDACLVR